MNALPRLIPLSLRAALTALTTLTLTTASGCASAPKSAASASEVAQSRYGVLVMAHGGTPEWNASVEDAVAPLKARYPLEIAFGMADAASLKDAVIQLESQGVNEIGVVRLFVSGESFTDATEQILGLAAGAPSEAHAHHAVHPVMAAYMTMYGNAGHGDHAGHGAATPPAGAHAEHGDHHAHAGHGAATPPAGDHAGHGDHHAHAGHGAATPPAGDHGDHGGHSMAFFRVMSHATFALSHHGLIDADPMGQVLATRALALSQTPAKEDVLILAHGPGDDAENARWLANLNLRADTVRTAAPFRRVQVETLREDWPDKRAEAEKRLRAFVAEASKDGGTTLVIPFRLQGFGPYADVFKDLTYRADGHGLLPHPAVTEWIAREAEALRSGPFRAQLPLK